MSAPGNAQIEPDRLTQTGGSPKPRTLHEPPDIWELVHETRSEFKPGSAFAGHLKALHPLVLALILLIIGSGAVFGFMRLRDRSATNAAAPPAQVETSNPKPVVDQQPTESNQTASSSDQPTNKTPAPSDTPAGTSDEPRTVVAAPAPSSGNKVMLKPGPQNSTSSTTAVGETVAGARNKNRAQSASKLSTAVTATVIRTNKKDGGQASPTLDPKSEKEKTANPTPAKKEADKALSPQLIAPAKAGPTPKAKVIPWP